MYIHSRLKTTPLREIYMLKGVLAAAAAGLSFSAIARAQTLVINEVDYDQPGTDTTEFIEIYNPTGSAVNLTGYEIVLFNGALNPATNYLRLSLAPAGTIPAGGYLVAGPAVIQPTLPLGTLFVPFSIPSNIIQNGAPDGIALVNTATQTVVDTLSYEGSVTATTLAGFSSFSLVQGTPTPLADDNAGLISLARFPNGHDTNDDSSDWALTTPTPGAPNTGDCDPPTSASTWAPASACPGDVKVFTVTFSGDAPFTFMWLRNGSPVNVSGPRVTVLNAGSTSTLTINSAMVADTGNYRCDASNDCGDGSSGTGVLIVSPADLGSQGGVPGADGEYDNNDFVLFIDAFFNHLPAADIGSQGGIFGPDGVYDNNDFVVFIDFFFAGCP